MIKYRIIYPYEGLVTAEQLQDWAYDRMVDAGLIGPDTVVSEIDVNEAIDYLEGRGDITLDLFSHIRLEFECDEGSRYHWVQHRR